MNRFIKENALKATWLALATLALSIAPCDTFAQGKGPFVFTYGGQLLSTTGEPLKGPVNLELKFYRAASGGDALPISPVSKSGVELTPDGVFQLDVENLADAEMHLVFDGSKATWVEVIANGRAYPRQKLVAVPFALKVPVDGKSIRFDSNGRLAVGPSAAPMSGQFLTRNNTGEWMWDTPPSGSSGGSTSNAMQKSSYDVNDNAIVDNAEKLGGNSPSHYLNGANLAAGTIGNAQLQNDAITSVKLQNDAVTSTKLQDAAVTSAKLQNDAVTSTKLQNDAVTTAKLQDTAVTTAKLQDAAVTSAKVLDGAITSNKLAGGAILKEHLSASTPTSGQILSYNGSNLMWIYPSGGSSPVGSPGEIQWNGGGYLSSNPNLKWDTGTNTLYVGSKIGIGTNAPQTKLDVSGGVKIGDELATCISTLRGTLRDKVGLGLQYCDGTSWQTLALIPPMAAPHHIAFRFSFGSCGAIQSVDPSFYPTATGNGQYCQINFPQSFMTSPICTCSVELPSFSGSETVHSCLITNSTVSGLKVYALQGSSTTTSTQTVNVTCLARN